MRVFVGRSYSAIADWPPGAFILSIFRTQFSLKQIVAKFLLSLKFFLIEFSTGFDPFD